MINNHQYFGSVAGTEPNKQHLFQNYFVIQDPVLQAQVDEYEETQAENKNIYFAFQEPHITISEPKASIWEFLGKDEVHELLKCRSSWEIRKYLEGVKMEKYCPKGKNRIVFLDLMHSVMKFCKKLDYSTEKSGALMSQFYLTHILLTTAFDKSAEKVYTYFKELALCHTLPDFPPRNAKIFSQEETKINMQYFCRIYLRNLPLIRFLCLPNFAFYCKYSIAKTKVEKTKSFKSTIKLEKKKKK